MLCSVLTVSEEQAPEVLAPAMTPEMAGVAEQQVLTADDGNCPLPDAVAGDAAGT